MQLMMVRDDSFVCDWYSLTRKSEKKEENISQIIFIHQSVVCRILCLFFKITSTLRRRSANLLHCHYQRSKASILLDTFGRLSLAAMIAISSVLKELSDGFDFISRTVRMIRRTQTSTTYVTYYVIRSVRLPVKTTLEEKSVTLTTFGMP